MSTDPLGWAGEGSADAAAAPLASRRPPRWQVWSALVAVYLIWGSTYVAVSFAIESVPPLLQGGFRYVVAGALLFAILAVIRGRAAVRVNRPELITAVIGGLLLLLGGNGLVAVGQQGLTSSLAALLVAAMPLWLILLRAAAGDRPGLASAVGVLIGLAGVTILLLPGEDAGRVVDIRFALVVIAATLSWAAGSLVITRRPPPRDAFAFSAVQMVAGGGGMLLAGTLAGETQRVDLGAITTSSLLAIGYLIVFGSLVAFSSFAWLLQHAPVSQVSTYAYVNPAVAVFLGTWLREEPLTLVTLVGGAIIISAVAVVVAAEARQTGRSAGRP